MLQIFFRRSLDLRRCGRGTSPPASMSRSADYRRLSCWRANAYRQLNNPPPGEKGGTNVCRCFSAVSWGGGPREQAKFVRPSQKTKGGTGGRSCKSFFLQVRSVGVNCFLVRFLELVFPPQNKTTSSLAWSGKERGEFEGGKPAPNLGGD